MNLTHLKINNKEIKIMLESGFILREAGRLTEAEAIFQGLTELVPDSEVPLVALSTLEVSRRNFTGALNLCRQALSLNPNSLFTKINLAEILIYQEEFDMAEKILVEILKTDSCSPDGKRAEALLEILKIKK